MAARQSLDEYLGRTRISQDTWLASRCDWGLLEAIAADHDANQARLLQSAEFFAKLIQKFDCVHSVRWRVKETDHLLEKIIRKRAEGVAKYMAITSDNYFESVTDLVGIRALHLFKDDCLQIDTQLRGTWQPIENPVAYVRLGDTEELTTQFTVNGFEIKSHPAGYRSVHYVFASQPIQRKVITEVQVRTIFEEGWSEIDHQVRYPNLSDNALVAYFLTIFNRMAGSADEMGGFVRGLATTLQELQSQVQDATRDKEQTLVAMDKALGELESVKQQDRESRASVATLKAELEKLRHTPTLNSIFASTAATDPTRTSMQRILEEMRRSQQSRASLTELEKAKKTIDQGMLARLLAEKKKPE